MPILDYRLTSTLCWAAFAFAVLSAVLSTPAEAGLQRWSIVYLDKAGQPTTAANAASIETYARTQKGNTVSIGCAVGGGYMLALHAPEGTQKDYAGEEIEPSVRISKPGTDLFLGPTGKMVFDGERYVGPLPEAVVASLRERIRDGLLTVAEYVTRSTVALKTAGLERTLAEINCD